MTDYGPPRGVERRRERQTELAQAMADVVELQESVTTLAGAVGKVVPDKGRMREALVRVALMLAALIVVQTLIWLVFVNHIVGRVDHGHDELRIDSQVVTCMLKLADATRAAAPEQSELTCRQSAESQN